jgi:hypothetical protein
MPPAKPDPLHLIATLQATVLDLEGRLRAATDRLGLLEQRVSAMAHPAAAPAKPAAAPSPAPATAKRRPRSAVIKPAPVAHSAPSAAAPPAQRPGRRLKPPPGKPPRGLAALPTPPSPPSPAAPPTKPKASAKKVPGAAAQAQPLTPAAQAEADERARILAALEATNWNRLAAAQSLGMARRTLYRRLSEYGIQ